MLSRVANRSYWLARYLERAENAARLINVYSGLLLDLPPATGLRWEVVVEITGATEVFATTGYAADDRAVLGFLLHDETNPSSLVSCLGQARENARTTRDIVPTECWRAVNELYMYAGENLPKAAEARQRAGTMSEIVERVQAITGLLASTMSHGQPYQFLRLGRNLERADMTTRMIDMAAAVLMTGRPELERYDNTLWMTVLRCLSAYQMYRQYVRRRVRAPDVMTFLLQDASFPRALMHCAVEIEVALRDLPRSDEVAVLAEGMRAHLQGLAPDELDNRQLHDLVDALQLEIAGINDAIAATWFNPDDEI